jgi:hypothetical protein
MCIRCRGGVFTELLPSNERLFLLSYSGFQAPCHIVPSLRLLVPSSLQAYRHFFSEGCAIDNDPRLRHRKVIVSLTLLPVSTAPRLRFVENRSRVVVVVNRSLARHSPPGVQLR